MIADDSIDKLEQTWGVGQRASGTRCREEQWKAPTDCPGWNVQDNVAT